MEDFNIDLSETTTFNIILFALIAVFVYFYAFKEKSHKNIVYVQRPVKGSPVLSIDDEELLGVAPVQRLQPPSVQLAKVGFPLSPVMPDLNVIDGVAPYNPEISGNEWGASLIKGSSSQGVPGKDAVAYTVSVSARTPTPKLVPVPTMLPSPLSPEAAIKETFDDHVGGDPYNGYVNRPQIVTYKKPINAVMSKWTQFGPCSMGDNVKERTRTCVHDGIDGGNPCGHTIERTPC